MKLVPRVQTPDTKMQGSEGTQNLNSKHKSWRDYHALVIDTDLVDIENSLVIDIDLVEAHGFLKDYIQEHPLVPVRKAHVERVAGVLNIVVPIEGSERILIDFKEFLENPSLLYDSLFPFVSHTRDDPFDAASVVFHNQLPNEKLDEVFAENDAMEEWFF